MSTYNLTFNDSLVEGIKHAFPSQAAITEWMRLQIERMLKQMAVPTETSQSPALRKICVSDKIKALSAVPASSSNGDYKDEMTDVLFTKYGCNDEGVS